MSKLKKIGLLIPNLESGGAERVLSITSNLLSQAGYDVYFLMYDTDSISYNFSGKLVDLRSKAGSNIISKIFVRLKRVIKISYYKNKFDLDIVISFLYSANIVNFFSIGKAKKILACRGYTDYLKNGKKYSRMINKVDSFIVQTERMKSDFISDFNVDASKIKVLYNPFDINLIGKRSGEKIEKEIRSFIDTHKTICTVGSFKKDKGYWHLIKSFIRVRQSIENAGLIFIGHRGEMEKEIKNMSNLSGFKEDILFIGYQENPFKYISKCDLYVCSSIHEGFPNTLVEAMALGVSVVSTDCKTGPREILCGIDQNQEALINLKLAKYGLLVPQLGEKIDTNINSADDEEIILAEAIINILNDNSLLSEYSRKSKVRAEEFNVEGYLNKLIRIIEQA